MMRGAWKLLVLFGLWLSLAAGIGAARQAGTHSSKDPTPEHSSPFADSSTLDTTVFVGDLTAPARARKEADRGRQLLLKEHKAADSAAAFRKAIELAPSYSEAYFLLGAAYMGMQRWVDAEEPLLKAVLLDDKLSAARLALGSCMIEEGKYLEAEKYLLSGLRSNPNFARGHYDLSRAYYGLRRFEAAVLEGRTAVILAPELPNTHVVLGYALLSLHNDSDALLEFQAYLRLAPNGELAAQVRDSFGNLEDEFSTRDAKASP
jgi:tetratricopeptide (TPR) repeat protein